MTIAEAKAFSLTCFSVAETRMCNKYVYLVAIISLKCN